MGMSLRRDHRLKNCRSDFNIDYVFEMKTWLALRCRFESRKRNGNNGLSAKIYSTECICFIHTPLFVCSPTSTKPHLPAVAGRPRPNYLIFGAAVFNSLHSFSIFCVSAMILHCSALGAPIMCDLHNIHEKHFFYILMKTVLTFNDKTSNITSTPHNGHSSHIKLCRQRSPTLLRHQSRTNQYSHATICQTKNIFA